MRMQDILKIFSSDIICSYHRKTITGKIEKIVRTSAESKVQDLKK